MLNTNPFRLSHFSSINWLYKIACVVPSVSTITTFSRSISFEAFDRHLLTALLNRPFIAKPDMPSGILPCHLASVWFNSSSHTSWSAVKGVCTNAASPNSINLSGRLSGFSQSPPTPLSLLPSERFSCLDVKSCSAIDPDKSTTTMTSRPNCSRMRFTKNGRFSQRHKQPKPMCQLIALPPKAWRQMTCLQKVLPQSLPPIRGRTALQWPFVWCDVPAPLSIRPTEVKAVQRTTKDVQIQS